MDQELFTTLYQKAAAARNNSYSPMSKFKVGAAIRTATGNIYAGTNVEEAAVTSSIHAEQACVAQMVTIEGHQEITHVLVVGGPEDDAAVICVPCGHCRQLLGEFATDDTEVVVTGPKGDIRHEGSFGALMPLPFSFASIK